MNAAVEIMLDDPIEIALAEDQLALVKKRQRWNTVKGFYRPILNALQLLGIEPELGVNVDLSFAGDAHKLAAVVRILRTSGFKTLSERPKVGDTSWHGLYTHRECTVAVWLNFTSSVCRRVKIGTKMVEQDVYETKCDQGDLTEAFPAIAASQPALVDEVPF